MGKPDVHLKLGRATTVDGPFALVGTKEELQELGRVLHETATHHPTADGEEIEVWLGANPYSLDEIATALESLAKKVRGDG